jgi:hypothetical protein
MKDYFNDMCNARAQLAGANTIMKGYLEAIEQGNDFFAEGWLKVMKNEVVEIEKLLNTDIGE